MVLLIQFVLRLAFGLALAMALVPSRWVTSGYFRVHSYVLLGLHALAAVAAWGGSERLVFWLPLTGALLSYAAAVLWLYEQPRAGKVALGLVALVSLASAWQAAGMPQTSCPVGDLLVWLDPVAGGFLLGVTMAAMLLGHWYLNTPTMKLEPLKRLVVLLAAAVVLRALVAGAGAGLEWALPGELETRWLLLLGLRWAAGIAGALVLAVLTWQTLKIPNTQSATGILYVAVIATFLGELTSQLLSAESRYPV